MNKFDNLLKMKISYFCDILDMEYVGCIHRQDVCEIKYKNYSIEIFKLDKNSLILSIMLFRDDELEYYCKNCTPFELYMEMQERMPQFSIAIDSADHIMFSCRARSYEVLGFELVQLIEVADCASQVKELMQNC